MSNTDVKQYGIQYQLYLLSQIFSNPEIFVRCKNILRPEYFDKEYHSSIEYIHEYSQKYSEIPPLVDVKFKAGFEYDDIKVTELHQGAVLDSVAEFCRHKALALAVQKSMELVHQKKYGGIEELIREAQLVTIQNELGLDIYEDPENVIRSLANMQGTFKTGWETLDFKLFGGFGRQELEIFAAASGGGKSVVLQNLAVNFTKSGLNGAYITLELASELVAVRIYGMMANVAQAQIKNDVENSVIKIKMEGKKNGELRIHRLPESVSTANDIESYIRELQIKTGIKLDYVCVDYLDLLTSDRCGPNDKSNAFVKDKFVSEELRALAMKMDLTVFTACQFNRSGVQEEKKSQSQIAGGISKIYTADNVIFIEARKESGEMWFDFQKTRNSSAVGSRLRMSYDMHSLRVLDHALTVQQMELEGNGFKHSGNTIIGNADVISHPSAPSTMQLLRRDLTNKANKNDDITPSNDLIPEISNVEVSGSDTINTKNESSSSNTRISNMRDFLTKRK